VENGLGQSVGNGWERVRTVGNG